MKRNKWILVLTITALLVILETSCKKKESNDNNNPPVQETGTVTDVDGNIYKTVKIGSQWWMAENLKVTHYRNGDLLPNYTDSLMWSNTLNGARCYYNNDSIVYASVYGALYNWYAINDSRQISPLGWHVPSDAEWIILLNYLGGLNIASGKMKETGTSHWQSPNSGANNSSGFTALPGGGRVNQLQQDFYFIYLGLSCDFWSSTENEAQFASGFDMSFYDETVGYSTGNKFTYGASIRCIKD